MSLTHEFHVGGRDGWYVACEHGYLNWASCPHKCKFSREGLEQQMNEMHTPPPEGSVPAPVVPPPKPADSLRAVVPPAVEWERPDYYGGEADPFEPIKIIEHYGLNFNLGNAVKYVLRAGRKPKVPGLADLQKAYTYIGFEIRRREREFEVNRREREGGS